MKKISILMLMIAAILLSACKKDDNDSPDENGTNTSLNGYRPTEFEVYSDNDLSGKQVIKYVNNKIIEISGFGIEKGVKTEYKTTFSYKDNEVTLKDYTKVSGEWKQDGREVKSIVKNGLLLEEITKYIERPDDVYKTKYTYEGKKLVKKEEFSNGELDKTDEYKYSEGKVEVIEAYGEQVDGKEVIIYKGDKIDKIEYYDYSDEEKKFVKKNNGQETRYIYSGKNISQIEEWRKPYDPKTNKLGEFQRVEYSTYKYDANGNLVEETTVSVDDEEQKESKFTVKYKYEKGKVNFVVTDPVKTQIYKYPGFN